MVILHNYFYTLFFLWHEQKNMFVSEFQKPIGTRFRLGAYQIPFNYVDNFNVRLICIKCKLKPSILPQATVVVKLDVTTNC